jgi:hypothetical protein
MILDEELLYDICLYKWNNGLPDVMNIKIHTIEQREDDILVSFDVSNRKMDVHTLCLLKSEYLNLLRQKKLKNIGI